MPISARRPYRLCWRGSWPVSSRLAAACCFAALSWVASRWDLHAAVAVTHTLSNLHRSWPSAAVHRLTFTARTAEPSRLIAGVFGGDVLTVFADTEKRE
jgi:hypothetical protein